MSGWSFIQGYIYDEDLQKKIGQRFHGIFYCVAVLQVLSLNLYSSEDQPPAAKKAKIITKKDAEPKKLERNSKDSDTVDEDDDNDDDDDDDDDEDIFDEDAVSSTTTSWEDEEETKDIFAKADQKTKAIFEVGLGDLVLDLQDLVAHENWSERALPWDKEGMWSTYDVVYVQSGQVQFLLYAVDLGKHYFFMVLVGTG